MEELIVDLENFFSKNTRFYRFNELKKIFNIKGEAKEKILQDALNKMFEDGIVLFDKENGYKKFPKHDGLAYGSIYVNKVGTGFVSTIDGYTILIENSKLNGALDGDLVVVNNIFSKGKEYFYGEVSQITKRKSGIVIYRVIGDGDKSQVISYDKTINIPVNINKNDLRKLKDGDIVFVYVTNIEQNGKFNAYIDRIIGNKNDLDIDIKVICEKYNIPYEFNEKVLKEASLIKNKVTEEDIEGRIDLRRENIFTIDCDNTKDRDDSVGIKKLDNGNYLLKVNISHVSHYIKKDSEIFKEALKRTSSHYLADYCIPMIPSNISNGICSLDEKKDRLTKTVELEINNDGEIVDYRIYDSVINSKKAMSYSNVNKVLNGETLPEYIEFKNDLKLMEELNIILENARNKRNYINFDTPEIEALTDGEKNIIGFERNDYGVAGKIIENFMLVANTTVYRNFAWQTLAYRVHEFPDENKVKEVINILKASGIKIPKLNNIDSRSLKTIINNLSNDEVSQIVKEYFLKSMKKAKYDTKNIGHFALQYDIYGHFTSPIRRIIDLITHMTIDSIEDFDYSEESINNFEKFLNETCERANKVEKIDKIMSDEYYQIKMAEYMKNHIGESYEVYVTDILRSGMIVRTPNLISGKLRLVDMEDDKYNYNEQKYAIVGRNQRKTYHIGSKVIVLVKDAIKESGLILFSIPNQKKKVKST